LRALQQGKKYGQQAPVVQKVDSAIQLLNNWGLQDVQGVQEEACFFFFVKIMNVI